VSDPELPSPSAPGASPEPTPTEATPPTTAPPPNGGLLATAIDRPVTVIVCLLLVVLAGWLSVSSLPIQLTPDLEVPTLTVTTRWPGAAPAEVETEVIDPQEDALKGIQGLVSMRSDSRPDQGTITLEFEVGTDIDEALVRVSNRLTSVARYPEGAREPIIETSGDSGPPLSVIAIRHPKAEPVDGYRTWVETQIVPRLERIPGVASVRLRGGRDTEVHVDFDPVELAARKIPVARLAEAVRGELRDLSGGDIEIGKRRLLVRTPVAPDDPADLERVVLGAGPDGAPILLGDVATVRTGLRKAGGVAFSNDIPSLILLLNRETGANVLEISREIRTVVDELQRDVFAGEGLVITVLDDQTAYIEGALANVQYSIIVGGILAILVLWLYLRDLGAAAVIAVSIPTCVFGTALGMFVLGRTINVVSLAGTAFAVGMVVDASIVVLEAIATWRTKKATLREACLAAISEVWGALLASTLTTVVVFVPILTWNDEVGSLLRDVAVAITFAVSTSLLVAVLAIPALAARLLRRPRSAVVLPSGDEPADATLAARTPIERVRAGTATLSARLATRPAVALPMVVGVVAITVVIARVFLPAMEYLPTGNRNLVFGILTPPPGYGVTEIDAIGRQMTGHMAAHFDRDEGDVPAIGRAFFVGEPASVFMGASAKDPNRVPQLAAFIRNVQGEVPGMIGFASQASLFGGRLGSGRAVEVEIGGPDLAELVAVGGKMMALAKEKLPGAQIRPIPSLELGAPEIHVEPLRARAAALGVGGAELGLVVDALVDGAFVGEWGGDGRTKLDVLLRAKSGGVMSERELAQAPVATSSGRVVPLSSVASVERRLGPAQIQRIERRRAIILQITPPENVALEDALRVTRNDVLATLRESGALEGIDLQISGTAGKLELAQQRFLTVLLLAVVVTYLLLSALYEDFIAPISVMVTMPLAAAGGVLALVGVNALMGPLRFDLMTAMGFLILVGVVVNNAILVVDGALARLRDGLDLETALRGSVAKRIRPIFMTTATSLAGLTPLVVVPGSGSELYRGIGAVVLGGLALSTLLTLFVVPAVFALTWQLRQLRVRSRGVA
jgi:HAE1 family hydrophobic/amphiphilic exporter-1